MLGTEFKKRTVVALAAITGLTGIGASALTINGAGASFPAPVYRNWTYNYQRGSGTTVNYQSVGSGAGITQIKNRTVNFGASDEPLKKEELDQAGLIQFPMLMGGVVVVVNLPGIEPNKLQLSGSLLADLFLGKIKTWNDPQIAKLNPGLTLPDVPVTVVHRSDGSGTTWIFTNYLTKVSKDWADGPGCGKAVKWPAGVGGQKNPGVAINVTKINGAIGYVEYTYATEAKLTTVCLQNQAGKFVKPTLESFQTAGANADWQNAPGFYMVLTNQPGEATWPITGVTYILIHRNQADQNMGKELLNYFSWCYKDGAVTARKMEYVPMPDNVVEMIKQLWAKELNVK